MNELEGYLNKRTEQCPNEVLVLAGYSQGAHVVSKALSYRIHRDVRDRIAFVALFADPTVWFPKGNEWIKWGFRGWFRKQAACNGDLEPWRRGTPPCQTLAGILATLEKRDVYLPFDLTRAVSKATSRVGVWCDGSDPICTHRLEQQVINDTHERYADRKIIQIGGITWIQQAVDEAASKLTNEVISMKYQYQYSPGLLG